MAEFDENNPEAGDPKAEEQLSEGTQNIKTLAEMRAKWMEEARRTGKAPRDLPPQQRAWMTQAILQTQRNEERYRRMKLKDEENPDLTRDDPYTAELATNEAEVRTKEVLNQILYRGDPLIKGKVMRERHVPRGQATAAKKLIEPKFEYKDIDPAEVTRRLNKVVKTQLYGVDPATGTDKPVPLVRRWGGDREAEAAEKKREEDILDFRRSVMESYFGMGPTERRIRRAVIDKEAKASEIPAALLNKAKQESADIRFRAQRESKALADRLAKEAAREKGRIAAIHQFNKVQGRLFPDLERVGVIDERVVRSRVKKTEAKTKDELLAEAATLNIPGAAAMHESALKDAINEERLHKYKAGLEHTAKLQRYVTRTPPGEERLHGGTAPITTADMLANPEFGKPGTLRANIRQTKRITESKLRSLKDGKLVLAFNSSGKAVDPNDKEAVLRLSPNAQWEYLLKKPSEEDPLATDVTHVPYWDQKQRFIRARNPDEDTLVRAGDVLFIDEDKFGNRYIVKKPVLHERLVPKQRQPIAVTQAERQRRDKIEPSKNVSKEVFVPLKGVETHSKYIDDPEKYEQRLVKTVMRQEGGAALPGSGEGPATTYGGQWVEASLAQWRAAQAANIPTDVKKLNKKIKVTYIDPDELERKRKEKDIISAQLPGPPISNETQAQLEKLGLIAPGHAKGRLIEYKYDPETKLGKLVEAQKEQAKRKQSFIHGPKVGTGVFRGEGGISLAQDVGAAAATALYYSQLNKATHGYIPSRINDAYSGLLKKHPDLKSFAEKKALGVEDDKLFAIKQAWLRPNVEKLTNLPFSIQHPASSPFGSAEPGFDISSWRYRKRFFPLGDARTVIPDREIEREQLHFGLVADTKSKVDTLAQKGGVLGKIGHQQTASIERTADYKNFYTPNTGYLAKSIDYAKEHMISEPQDSPARARAAEFHRQAMALQIKHRTDNILEQQKLVVPSLRPHTYQDFLKETGNPQRAYASYRTSFKEPRSSLQPVKLWSWDTPTGHLPDHLAPVPYSKHSKFKVPEFHGGGLTPIERNLLIGGAVAGTAVGAHYLYHKHQQSKLAPEDRQSYINRITPGPIKVPTPRIKATAHVTIPSNVVTNEFKAAGKQMPVQGRLGVGHRTIWKGSPEDRGYTSNAGLGLHQIRPVKGKRQGSLVGGLMYDPETVYGKRQKVIRPSGMQPVVGGKKLPIRVRVGKQEEIKLTGRNPNKLSQEDRENIIWAFHGHPDEDAVKEFFGHGKQDRILSMWENKELIDKIRQRKGEYEGRKLASGQFIADSARLDETKPPDFDGVSPSTYVSPDLEQMEKDLEDARATARGEKRPFMGRGHPGDVWNLDRSGLGGPRTKVDEVFDVGRGEHQRVERPVGRRRQRPGTFDAADIKARRYDK